MRDTHHLEIHEALDVLAIEDPAKAEVVKLRFFAGLTHGEIATLLSICEKTARRHWQLPSPPFSPSPIPSTEFLELPSGGHGLNGDKDPMWDAWQTGSLKWLEPLQLAPAAGKAP